jgi:hypothetical protein
LARKLPGSLPVTADMTKFDEVRDAIRWRRSIRRCLTRSSISTCWGRLSRCRL